MSSSSNIVIAMLISLLSTFLLINGVASSIDYGDALTKSLLFYEAQRSGKLPDSQRVQWRGDSALDDGSDASIDLSGGYYDAGDNMKFGFPMAFTATMLAWSTIEFRDKLDSKSELQNALDAIKWATDYFIKAHPSDNVLYAQVGEGASDHSCWQRPEDMTTPRPTYKIDSKNPGADIAAETAAALAAASIAFNSTDADYAATLLTHARQLFEFARRNPSTYQTSIPAVSQFYSSSGYEDELNWAAAWLFHATNDKIYADFLTAAKTGGVRTVFSWDDKYLGAQVLLGKLVIEGKVPATGMWVDYKGQAEHFICNCMQRGESNVKKTPGGLLWFLEWNNLQYTTTATFVAAVYSQYLASHDASFECSDGDATAPDLSALVQSQVDYILGSNPKSMSYMVGFGSSYPQQPHHRGASIVSLKEDPTPVSCQGGFDVWFNKNEANPNVLDGAIVGGPDANDSYDDVRSNFKYAEPTTVTVAPLIGALALLI